eukprot:gnl/TRDRNA2_/TRDRNA2_88871_c0_seq2.p1 gnl/TRDRNA2_/TRDRNA2_88871_c0~~gnl/TRDRNA2_/TRDRNA2_88871_c0_seq2.p1  ORF type:complete len:186 (-),score=37.65 gnl/TRDRNA2_/TRDRNA2_88871_c0_seq2:99-605(-)
MDPEQDGRIRRGELKRALEAHPELIHRLTALDIQVTKEEVLTIFNRLNNGRPVPVDVFIDALTHVAGRAKASAVFDLKLKIQDARKENKERYARAQHERDEVRYHMATLRANVKADLTAAHDDVLGIRAGLAELHRHLDELCGINHHDKHHGHGRKKSRRDRSRSRDH